jgi:hypothetical protein
MPQARAVPTERMLGKPEARGYGRFIGCPAVADALPLLVVLGSHQHALSAEQSAAPVFLLGCLRAVADVAATGTGGDGVGQGAVLHTPAQVVEDRRADPHYGTHGMGLAGGWLSQRRAVPASL